MWIADKKLVPLSGFKVVADQQDNIYRFAEL